MILYHGSDCIVDEPKILENDRFLDFGVGFYTTKNKEQAMRWADKVSVRRKSNNQFISIYDFDFDKARNEIKIIEFADANEEWLNFVCGCRVGKILIDYDIVIGPVADDTIYTTVSLYENGLLDKDETIKRLKVEALYNQVLFHNKRALEFLSFKEYAKLGDGAYG
jgi:hypothetical protein